MAHHNCKIAQLRCIKIWRTSTQRVKLERASACSINYAEAVTTENNGISTMGIMKMMGFRRSTKLHTYELHDERHKNLKIGICYCSVLPVTLFIHLKFCIDFLAHVLIFYLEINRHFHVGLRMELISQQLVTTTFFRDGWALLEEFLYK